MEVLIKKIFFSILFNSSLFLLLIIVIQNSSKESRVNLMINETVSLPVSFIVGTSFISGSIVGSFLSLNFTNKSD